MIALLFLHVLMCMYLFGSVFVRSVLMEERSVHANVRFVFWLTGVVALWGLAAPIVWAWSPDLYSTAVTLAFCSVQFVTGKYWRDGVPDRFCKPDCLPRSRRATDMEATQ